MRNSKIATGTLRTVGLSLATAACVLVVCVGGFVGFVLFVAGLISDPAPKGTPEQYGPYGPETAGAALVLLSFGALIWFFVLAVRGRHRLGLTGLASVALAFLLGLLVIRLV